MSSVFTSLVAPSRVSRASKEKINKIIDINIRKVPKILNLENGSSRKYLAKNKLVTN